MINIFTVLAIVGAVVSTAAWAIAVAKCKIENGKCRIAEFHSKFSIHTAAFVFFATIATLSAQKQGGGTNDPPRGGNVELRIENGELRNGQQSLFSIDGFYHGTNADLIAFSWTTNFSPARAWLEIYGKASSLTNAWEPRLSVQAQPGETNATVSVAATNAPAAFYTARFDTLRIDAPGCRAYAREDGSRLFVSDDGSLTVPVAVSRPGRSPDYPAPDPAFAADPFANANGLSYDPVLSTVTAGGYGSYDLPDGGTVLLIKQPVVTFGVPHSYPGRSTAYDQSTGAYSLKSPYPLNSRTLWRSFRRGSSPLTGCSCVPKVDYGNGLVVSMGDAPTRSGAPGGFPDGVDTRFTPKDGGVLVELLYCTNVIWSGWCAHDRSPGEDEDAPDDVDDEDGGESECGCGDMDDIEAPSLGSIRFRIPLGNPQEDEMSGFLYIDSADLFVPTPSMFQVLARADAHVEDSTENGVRTVACSDNRGRTLVISRTEMVEEVEIQVRSTADNSLLHTWFVQGDGETEVRFVKMSVKDNVMKAVSYTRESGVLRETDELSGRTDVRETTYVVDGAYSREDSMVLLGGSVARRVISDYSLVGTGPSALLRRTLRRELGAGGAWKERASSYWSDAAHEKRHGRLRMESGDDVPWSWRSYDDGGRETFRLDERDGSQPPPDAADWSLANLPPSAAAFATTLDYEPLPGDSSRSNDWEKARTESRYVVDGGAATLVGRTWTVYEHGLTNVYPVVVATRVRACRADAAIDDPGNETTVEARYDDRSGEVPYTLRGELVWAVDADGVTTMYDRSVSNGTVRTVVRRVCGAAESPTRRVEVRDLAYGNLVHEAESPTSDPAVEFGCASHIYDEKNRLRSTTYDDGTFETNAYSCCRLLWSQNREGAKRIRYAQTGTDHLYHAYVDESVRYLPKDGYYRYGPWSGGKFDTYAPVTDHRFDGLGRETNAVMRTGRIKEDGFLNQQEFNNDGLFSSSATAYPQGVSDVSETVGFRGLRTLKTALFSQPAETTVEEEYEPGETAPSVVATNIAVRGGGTVEWRGGSSKWSCRRRFSEYAANGCRIDYDVTESSDCGVATNSVSECDFLGRVVRREIPLSAVDYSYDGASRRILSTFDEVSGVAATNIYDEVGELVGTLSGGEASMRLVDYECDSGAWWRVETSFSVAGGATNTVRTTRTRLTGLSDALRSEIVETVDGVVESRTTSAYDAAAETLRTTTTNATAGVSWTVGKYGYPIETGSGLGTISNVYGPVGKAFIRRISSPGVGSRELDVSMVDALGDELARIDCDGTPILNAPVSQFDYDCRGNRCEAVDALGSSTTTLHDADGNVVAEDGATYPARFGYDTQDRRVALRTTRDGAVWDETAWRYDAATGLCTNKVYADGSAVAYTHTPDGLPLRTTYAGGRWTENLYDANRRLVGAAHSDGEVVSFAYDAFSNEIASSNDVAAANLDRNVKGDCTNETAVVGGESKTIARRYDAFRRLIESDGTFYAYADDGLLASISNDLAVVEYSYTPDRLDAGYTLTLSNGVVFTRSLVRDAYRRSLVTAVANVANGAPVESLAYAYDALSRPTTRGNDSFAYNERSEVVAAQIGTNLFAHAYDYIGNQTNFVSNAATNTYTHNCLNQIETAAISQFSILNSPFSISHDLDGNLTNDCVFTYAYDAANRLRTVSSNGVLLVANFYDAKSRRVKKVTQEATMTFFYDAWNLVEERIAYTNGTSSTINYFWGKDLSGTLQGAGGVGGLLYLTVDGCIYIPCYDNNGNITRYLDDNGNTVAQYTYDAFGNSMSTSGPLADFLRHRFSTKYFDDETGLYYYGYRFYSPTLMRWLNRDPIEERGGLNLYGFCGNNAMSCGDILGREIIVIRHLLGVIPPGGWGDSGKNFAQTHYKEPDVSCKEIPKGSGKIGFSVTITPPISVVNIYFRDATKLFGAIAQENEHLHWIQMFDDAIETFKKEAEQIVDCPKEAYFKLTNANKRMNSKKAWAAAEDAKLDVKGGPHGH